MQSMSTLSENAPPVCPCPPWIGNPYRPVTLLDMLRVYATNFMRVAAYLDRCAKKAASLLGFNERKVDAEDMAEFKNALETIWADVESLNLSAMTETIQHYRERIDAGNMTYGELSSAAPEIFRIYQGLVRKEVFLHVNAERTKYLDDPELFGPDLATALPASYSEIMDGAACYAKEQDTACVMHLMRGLEVALTVLADKFAVKSDREQWHNIIERIQKAVNSLGPSNGADWKEQQEFYSTACSHFMHFKNAWRNHAMHSRTRYSGPEAFRVLDHAGEFIRILSQRLHE